MGQEVPEALLADILGVPRAVIAKRRLSGDIAPQPNGNYRLSKLAGYPEVRALLTSRWDTELQIPDCQPTVLELFAGGGGMALGLESAGFRSVGLYEKDSHACATLKRNRPHWSVHQKDVTTVDFTTYRNLDLVAGGFPCQAFSYAGEGKGFADTRGTLFYEFARAIQEARPKVFLGENVRGLVNHDDGRTMETIKTTLSGLGYTLIEPRVLKALFYGVPQKRERLFLVGIRNDLSGVFKWPSPHHRVFTLRDALKAGDLFPVDCPSSPGIDYSAARKAVYELVPEGGCWQDLPEDVQRTFMGSSLDQGGGKSGVARRLSWDQPSLTVLCSPSQKRTERIHPNATRPLTIRESARIQTFPDSWEFAGSVTAQYRQIGNAVPVNLAAAMGRSLVRLLQGIEVPRRRPPPPLPVTTIQSRLF